MALLHRPLALLGLGMTLLCLGNPALAKDFYKWQDAEGVTHYSAQPSKEYKSVKVRASNIRDPEAPAATARNDEAAPAATAPAAGNAAAREHVKDPERCAAAQANRKTLEENSRIRMQDGDEFRYLTPEEIQQQKDTADQIIAEEC